MHASFLHFPLIVSRHLLLPQSLLALLVSGEILLKSLTLVKQVFEFTAPNSAKEFNDEEPINANKNVEDTSAQVVNVQEIHDTPTSTGKA